MSECACVESISALLQVAREGLSGWLGAKGPVASGTSALDEAVYMGRCFWCQQAFFAFRESFLTAPEDLILFQSKPLKTGILSGSDCGKRFHPSIFDTLRSLYIYVLVANVKCFASNDTRLPFFCDRSEVHAAYRCLQQCGGRG